MVVGLDDIDVPVTSEEDMNVVDAGVMGVDADVVTLEGMS